MRRVSFIIWQEHGLNSLLYAVGVQGAGAFFCAAVSFGLTLGLGRVLGVAGFGQYVATLNLATLALIVMEFGWPRRVYKERIVFGWQTPELLTQAARHILLATVLSMFWAWHFQADVALCAVMACMGAVALMNLASDHMRGAGHFALEALWQSAGRVVSAIAIGLAVWQLGLATPAAVFTAWGVGLCIVLLCGRHWLAAPWRRTTESTLANYRQVLPFVMLAGSVAWLVKGDMVLLSRLTHLDPHELSMYAACTRLTEMGLLVFAPLNNVLLREFGQSPTTNGMPKLAFKLLAGIALLGVLAVYAASVLGSPLMGLLFGSEFTTAGSLLPWVLFALPFAAANGVMIQLLTAQGHEGAVASIMLLAGLALWAGLTWSVPQWGLTAAAVSVALAQVFALICALIFCFWRARYPLATWQSTTKW